MIEVAGVALATFFATIGPLDKAAVFAALTANQTAEEKRAIAIRGTAIGAVILLVFSLSGDLLLAGLGISLAALRTAGGILLLLIGIEMVFARSSGGTSTTRAEEQEAFSKTDISVFPLATPLIAGPGAMGASILLMANQAGDLKGQLIVIAALLGILSMTLASLLLAARINTLLGVTGMHVVTRIMGVLLTALAVQFIFDGVSQSGIL